MMFFAVISYTAQQEAQQRCASTVISHHSFSILNSPFSIEEALTFKRQAHQ